MLADVVAFEAVQVSVVSLRPFIFVRLRDILLDR